MTGEPISRFDLRFTRKATLRGTVTDAENGNPIEGALVCLTGGTGAREFEARAVTGADGHYEITSSPPESVCIDVMKPGFSNAPGRRFGLRDGDTVTCDVRLLPSNGPPISIRQGTTVSGLVSDAGGVPLAGALVRVVVGGDVAVTDVGGRFRLDDQRPGRWEIECRTPRPTHFGTLQIDLEDGRDTNVVVRMNAGLRIRGRVRRDEGVSPPWTRITAAWSVPGDTTIRPQLGAVAVSASGEFETWVAGDADWLVLRPEAPGYASFGQHTDWPGHGPSDTAAIATASGRTTGDVDVFLSRGAALTGRVVDKETGAPIAGAWVLVEPTWIVGIPLQAPRTATAADGTFRVEHLAPRKWAVGIEAAGFAPTGAWMDTGDDPPATFELVTARTIEGRVRFADGRPADAILVTVRVDRSPPMSLAGVDGRCRATTDSTGHFRITGIPPGRFPLEVSARDKSPTGPLTKRIDPVAAGTRDVEIVLDVTDTGTKAPPPK